ncbi:hypothetical protein K439DRAFT_1352873 [Ramaria rubella]|nr:hypothetical protein K439DRAFT_1352873 [Ramaria rubella]
MGGASGWLRQEFRELEILDEITKLRYEKKLPSHITGDRRNTIIREYQLWKGTNFVPKHVHAALRWSIYDPFPLLEVAEDLNWYIHKGGMDINVVQHNIPQHKKVKFSHIAYVNAEGSKPLLHMTDNIADIPMKKKAKHGHDIWQGQEHPSPLGVKWNSTTSSCAYDALITIMYSLWRKDDNMAYNTYALHNKHWQLRHGSFQEVEIGTITLEKARD